MIKDNRPAITINKNGHMINVVECRLNRPQALITEMQLRGELTEQILKDLTTPDEVSVWKRHL